MYASLTQTTFLDIIRLLIFFKKHDVSEAGSASETSWFFLILDDGQSQIKEDCVSECYGCPSVEF
jgi:hypothetical protein